MTRERADNYDDKKRLILRKAAALFAHKGFQITTMMEVAKACNASKSHLYHYFPAKEDLLYEIIREHTALLVAELTPVMALPGSAIERFERFVEVFVDIAADSRNEQLVLTNNLQFLPVVKFKEITALESSLVAMMITLLEEISPRRMADVEVQTPTALLLFGMIIWTFTWYRKSGPLKPAALAHQITDIFLYGFASPSAAPDPSRRKR